MLCFLLLPSSSTHPHSYFPGPGRSGELLPTNHNSIIIPAAPHLSPHSLSLSLSLSLSPPARSPSTDHCRLLASHRLDRNALGMASEVWLSPASRLPSLSNAPPRFRSKPAATTTASLFSSCPRPARGALPVLRVRRRRRCLRATEQQGQVQEQEDEVVDSNILPYCNIDRKQKKTLGEMEQEFLQACQAFYFDQKAIMSNEEFDNLKEELMWEGSSVVMLSEDEQKLLEASVAYAAGSPIMSDAEFDELKLKLKTDGSVIVMEGPRCSLRSHKVYSDLNVDYLKMFLLNVPATTVALGLFFFIDELTGFEINVFQLPEPFGFIFTWFAALPLILFLAQLLTKAIVQDFLILKGPCPNCGTENLSFFGTILSVSSGGTTNKVKCANCSTELEYDSKSRVITLPEASSAYTKEQGAPELANSIE